MSWFDAGALANIAKSAIKGAQKTIDKALDIKDDGSNIAAVNAHDDVGNIVPLNTPIDSDDFFGLWGISHAANTPDLNKTSATAAPVENVKPGKVTSSIWGSFTGSFFVDNPVTKEETKMEVPENPNTCIEDVNDEQNDDKYDSENNQPESPKPEDVLDSIAALHKIDNETLSQNETDSTSIRLSVTSQESGKNNSESIDVITGYTESSTTPESDLLSAGLSTSSSIQGSKQVSESVEVLGDSLTSPSSVEVLGTDSNSSRGHSVNTDESSSSFDLSPVENKINLPQDDASPDSVEVIAEDQDENSVAEDTMSYTSISESTSTTVLDSTFNIHVLPQKMLKDTYNRSEFNESIVSDAGSLSPDKSYIGEAITKAPGRTMHLPLTQMLMNSQSSNQSELAVILEKSNIIDIPQQEDEELAKHSGSDTQLDTSTDDGSQSDRTVCETQESVMESSSDTTSTTTEASSNSTYLKKMLADAMVEKSPELKKNIDLSDKGSSSSHIEVVVRENSPISSEKSSDLVKVGSDQASGHTSCDELETTTSSDIEIISSPNGDSSSTQSRQSPARKNQIKIKLEDPSTSTVNDSLLYKVTIKKAKGHNRELSEASSISDDSHTNGDIDRLLKRIAEVTEILESRESKLIDVNRMNAELQEQNSDLKKQLDCVLTQQLESVDVSQVTEEYTQRLSALERKFQQAIREKDTLRKQLEQAKIDAAGRMSKNELEAKMSEKDELIKELRQEGEKLSKQQLQHSNIIKKLRAKEKELEGIIKQLKESNESSSLENERLKKSLSAKEEVERSQIEAIHNLTSKNKKLDQESERLKSQLDDLTQKYETSKKSLEAAKKELIDRNNKASELVMKQQLYESLQNEKKMTDSQNEEVINQLDDLRCQLQKSEEEYAKKEQQLRKENSQLLRRIEEAENRNEELSQSILEISKPLVRQIESLQSAYNMKVISFEKIEQELNAKLDELQSKHQTSINSARAANEECIILRSKLTEVEGQLSTAKHQSELSQVQSEQIKAESQIEVQKLKMEIENLTNGTIKKLQETISDKEKEIQNLLNQIAANNKELKENDKKEISRVPSAGLQEIDHQAPATEKNSPTPTRSSSPTISLGKVSGTESLSSSFWSQDEPLEMTSIPRYTNMFEMQILQSNLKQREGELQQLQWELNRRENERSLLNSEISNLITKVEDLEKIKEKHTQMEQEFHTLQQQYEILCELFGEKVEENEELKLDLGDVKEMYKTQIDELLKQQKKDEQQ